MENQMMIKLLHLLDNSYPGFTLVELLFIRVFLAGGMGHLTSLKSAYSPPTRKHPLPPFTKSLFPPTKILFPH